MVILAASAPARTTALKATQIGDFFTPLPKPAQARCPGRPPSTSKAKGRGRPTIVSPATAASSEAVGSSAHRATTGAAASIHHQSSASHGASSSHKKEKRENHGAGEALQRLTVAVHEFLEKSGRYLEWGRPSTERFSALVDIPYETFRKYVCADKGKRRVVGASVGKKRILKAEDEQFVVDVLRRRDRGNDAMTKKGIVDMIQDIVPGLQRRAAQQAFDRNVREKHSDVLTGIVKAQASTCKRSAITVPQQYRWHKMVDEAYDLLRQKNHGLTSDGKTFGEVMHHFCLGGDETGLQASDGNVSIIGDKLKAKHELPTADSRVRTTLYRVGSAAGNDGPTAFLPPGTARAYYLATTYHLPLTTTTALTTDYLLSISYYLRVVIRRYQVQIGLHRRLPCEARGGPRINHCYDQERVHDRGGLGRNHS